MVMMRVTMAPKRVTMSCLARKIRHPPKRMQKMAVLKRQKLHLAAVVMKAETQQLLRTNNEMTMNKISKKRTLTTMDHLTRQLILHKNQNQCLMLTRIEMVMVMTTMMTIMMSKIMVNKTMVTKVKIIMPVAAREEIITTNVIIIIIARDRTMRTIRDIRAAVGVVLAEVAAMVGEIEITIINSNIRSKDNNMKDLTRTKSTLIRIIGCTINVTHSFSSKLSS